MSRFGWLFRRRRHEDDLAEEITAHLDEKADELVARGMSRPEALVAARRAFGNITMVQEQSREVWRPPLFETVIGDIRHALRLARRHPAFSANVILISGLGMAACVATFSLVSGVLFAPLPFPQPERVFALFMKSRDGGAITAAVPAVSFQQVEAGSPVIEAIAAYAPRDATVQWNGEPEELDGEAVTPAFFRVFGVTPILGRAFAPDEAGGSAAVVIIGHRFWQSRYAGDSSVVGRTLVLNDVPHVVIGVMPAGFRAHIAEEPALWLPMQVAATGGRADFVSAMLRLSPGTTRQQAEAWLSTVVSTWRPWQPATENETASPVLSPIATTIYGDVERPLRVLLATVILVLVLVSASVATMFVANAQSRERELGVRRALGASAWRQVGQLVTESLTITTIGGVLGVWVSYWIVASVRTLGERVLPRMDTVALDWRVMVFAIAATMLTGIVGGLAPALTARRDTSLVPTSARLTSHRTPSVLVVVQVTLTVVLLIGAGLLGKGFLKVLPTDPGFTLENRATIMVNLRDDPGFDASDPAAPRQFLREVGDRLRATPGVLDVAATSFVPFFGSVSRIDVTLPGQPEPPTPLRAFQNLVTPNYLDVMEMPVLSGRSFTDADREGAAAVAMVNATAATRYWPGEDPIGRVISLNRGDDRVLVTVVGVVRDARLFGSDSRIRNELFLPVAQHSSGFITFVVHTDRAPALLTRDLHRAVWSYAPRLPIGRSSDLSSIAMNSVRRPRFFAVAMGIFAAAAVALSAIAVYGVLTLDVVQRRTEIGIRLAIGALPGRIGAMVLGRALALGGIGVLLGLSLSRGLSWYIESLLVEVTATDVSVYAGASVGVLLLAFAAACAPAWRAVRVDPVKSLRANT